MKAGELLRQLTANPFHEEYKGIYTRLGGALVQFTTAKPDDEGNLIFFARIEKLQWVIKHCLRSYFFTKTRIFYSGIIERLLYTVTV